MKKKLLITLLAIIATLTCALAFTACGGGINGTYYKIKYDGTLDESLYFKLESGNWEDDDGVKGTYKTEENKIRFYVKLFGENEVLAEGTVENGVLSIDVGGGMKEIYVKKDHQHQFSEWKTTVEATCTSDGIKTRTCACSVMERDITPALGHSGEWTVTKEATCTEEGSKTYNCTRCGEKENQSIDKLPHNYSTTYAYGINNHWKFCSVCGDKTDVDEHTTGDNCTVCGIPLVGTDGLRMTLNSDETGYTVIGIGSVTEKIIRIPRTYQGLPVTAIGNSAFRDTSFLIGIIIPDSVTSIGEEAFMQCSNLANVTIPDSVTEIQDRAFSGCSSLTNITIPNGVAAIWSNAFSHCSSLKSITIPDSVTYIGYNAFYNCSSLTNITIPDSVTTIRGFAFFDCTSLCTQTENGVRYLGKWAIGCDENVTHVTLRDDTIGLVDTFFNCTSLESITIPNSIVYISDNTFFNCTSLESITIPNSVTFIGESAFADCTSLTSITIPSSVTEIGDGAFYDCSSLTSISIPKIPYIGGTIFCNCSSLVSITFGGTKEEWKALELVNIGTSWNQDTGDYIIHCTDGTISKNGTVTKY